MIFRRNGVNRQRVHKHGEEGDRPAVGRLPLRSRGLGRAGTDLPQRPYFTVFSSEYFCAFNLLFYTLYSALSEEPEFKFCFLENSDFYNNSICGLFTCFERLIFGKGRIVRLLSYFLNL